VGLNKNSLFFVGGKRSGIFRHLPMPCVSPIPGEKDKDKDKDTGKKGLSGFCSILAPVPGRDGLPEAPAADQGG
jgi:hypothetical protein